MPKEMEIGLLKKKDQFAYVRSLWAISGYRAKSMKSMKTTFISIFIDFIENAYQ